MIENDKILVYLDPDDFDSHYLPQHDVSDFWKEEFRRSPTVAFITKKELDYLNLLKDNVNKERSKLYEVKKLYELQLRKHFQGAK